MSHAQTAVTVFAAGSLRGALVDVAKAFESERPGTTVRFVFGASGLLKDRLLAGEPGDLFASANMAHPMALAAAGRAEAVRPFAGNTLCALVAPGWPFDDSELVARLFDPGVRVGTSTPLADPSGDYAFAMFDRIEATGTGPLGSAARLKAKALQLTGGANTPAPAGGGSVYGTLVADGHADVFITYCTGAVAARAERPSLRVVPIPDVVNVSAQYGMALLSPASEPAKQLAALILGATGQETLRRHGFSPP